MMFIESGYVFLSVGSFIFFIKKINKLNLNTSHYLSFTDIVYCFLFVLFQFLLHKLHLDFIYTFVASFIFLIVWLDAVLLHCYGMKVTIYNIIMFSKGMDTFGGEADKILHTIQRFNWLISGFVFIVIVNISLMGVGNETFNLFLNSLVFTLFIFTFTKSKIKPFFGAPWVVVLLLSYKSIGYLHFSSLVWVNKFDEIIVFLIFLFGMAYYKRHEFILSKSIFSGLLRGNSIKKHLKYKKNTVVNILHKSKNEVSKKKYHGICKNANILVFTVESLSEEAYKTSPLAKELEETLHTFISVKRFYSVSPNTNQSLRQIYSSCYGHQGKFKLLNKLKERGYSTSFITTQNTDAFGMGKLIKDAGFDEVIESNDFPEGHTDYDVETIFLDKIADKLEKGKAFIHLLNAQTHTNYKVINKDKFNRCKNHDLKGRYSNAVDEALYIINQLLLSLIEKKVMDNTMVIITGDHGQSFGEFGYYAHSSSTINNQVRIPLLLSHPNIPNVDINQGSLLDLLPSILNLLGENIKTENIDGIDILNQQAEYILLYSDIRSTNSPSNAGLIFKDKKYYIDTIYDQKLILDLEDNKISEQEDKELIETIVYTALEKHQLIKK